TDFIEHLFGDARHGHQATGAGRLGHHEAAAGLGLDHRIAHVRPVRNLAPVGVQSPGRLAATLDDVASETTLSELVVLIGAPIEGVHQHAQCDRTVNVATGDHDVGS